jgi:hypothetical protein
MGTAARKLPPHFAGPWGPIVRAVVRPWGYAGRGGDVDGSGTDGLPVTCPEVQNPALAEFATHLGGARFALLEYPIEC